MQILKEAPNQTNIKPQNHRTFCFDRNQTFLSALDFSQQQRYLGMLIDQWFLRRNTSSCKHTDFWSNILSNKHYVCITYKIPLDSCSFDTFMQSRKDWVMRKKQGTGRCSTYHLFFMKFHTIISYHDRLHKAVSYSTLQTLPLASRTVIKDIYLHNLSISLFIFP